MDINKKSIDINKKEKRKKIKHLLWNLTPEIRQHENQLLLLDYDPSNNFCKLAYNHIQIKLNSYKNQDQLKSKYNPIFFISIEQIVDKLRESELTCFYCHNHVYLLYDIAFDDYQWTLDRIDNSLGHNGDNVLIACLKCNLSRRTQNKEKFDYAKNIVIIKLDENGEPLQ
jgi:hypothetical protein